jgi:hypothetical protein
MIEQYLVEALGVAVVRVIPSIFVVLVVAFFARQLWAFLVAGALPTLITPATALLAWWQSGRIVLTFQDDPTQQAYDNVVGVIVGVLIGYVAYAIKQRRRPST